MVLAQNIPYMKEFFYLEELESESYDENGHSADIGDISFVHVDFSYPNSDADVLKDIHVHIKNGEKIAVVGENGSGKSTFINLLCGMFDPKKGHITIGGTDISENPTAARHAVSVVFQDFARYEASLRENITISDKQRHATDDEIMELLKKINVNDVVEEQPNGLDEPTSALDPVAEAQLYRNFASLTGDKTTILISHRLGITAIVDRILVFKDG